VSVNRIIAGAGKELLPFGRLWLLVFLVAAFGVTGAGGGWGSGTFAVALMITTVSFLAITLIATAAWDLGRWVLRRRKTASNLAL
jgi:hypothetical protein